MSSSSLLLDLAVPFKRVGDRLLVEVQALNGMRLWAKHFEHVTVCATELPQQQSEESTMVWADPSELLAGGRVRFEPLPWGYHPRDHYRFRRRITQRLEELVPGHRYLCFSNLGAFGAWGTTGASIAHALGRPYSVWLDWVLHEMIQQETTTSLARRVRNAGLSLIVKQSVERTVRNCSLGLFHGQTVYDAYAPLCRVPALVHDVHIKPQDAISDQDLAAKISDTESRTTLRVGYVGRVHSMKGPFQWIEAMAHTAAALGDARLEATWIGDGPLLDSARARVQERGLQDSVRFRGFIADRAALLDFLRRQDVFAFCHLTPESPRCLIEALVSGTPLVGYESSYARELISGRGGGLLTPVGKPTLMARQLIQLANDRHALTSLVPAAATSRPIFNDEAVFSHRSDLIKRYVA